MISNFNAKRQNSIQGKQLLNKNYLMLAVMYMKWPQKCITAIKNHNIRHYVIYVTYLFFSNHYERGQFCMMAHTFLEN